MNIFMWPLSFLFLLLPVIFYFILPSKKEQSPSSALKVPFFKRIKAHAGFSNAQSKTKTAKLFLIISWIFFTIAAARPVWYPQADTLPLSARNIILSLDVSDSMAEEDFKINSIPVNRLVAVKKVVEDFLSTREKDNIGLVLFANEAYTYAPLSYDKKTLKSLLDEVGLGIAGSMTAMGDGLALAVQNALKVPAKSQIVILLSDGYSNAGIISLKQAIQLAQKHNIKVYTIGIGSQNGGVQNFYGMQIPVPSSLDEKTLKTIANETGGKYFLAETTDQLKEIYNIIDTLEKDETNEYTVKPKKELFFIPLFLALLCLLIPLFQRRAV